MGQSIHILYADDDEDDHIFFKEGLATLKELTCRITSAYNGAEVLDILLKKNRYANLDSQPQLIIIDLNMPIIDGFSLLAEMRSTPELKDRPVYVLSVSDKDHDKKRCMDLGCSGFYTKPVNFSKLTALIKDILQKENLGQ